MNTANGSPAFSFVYGAWIRRDRVVAITRGCDPDQAVVWMKGFTEPMLRIQLDGATPGHRDEQYRQLAADLGLR